MNKLIKSVMAAALLVGGGSLIELPVAHAQGSATVGSLRGQIIDKATGEGAVGATVVATSASLQGEQVVITEDGGQYFITSLPPGIYVLTVYYNDATFSRGNVLIQVGKEAVVNVTVDSRSTTGKPKGETIVIQGTAPIVDQGSTKTGMTITDDYTRNIPTARTFGGVVGQAAGAQSDNYGISFAGSTSVENTYIVEGINTTDTGFGGFASNLPNEFISETEVITGGYNAEFGRATGGIVNVVTKQGSNEFHGSVFGYVQPGALIAGAKTIQREGGSIDSDDRPRLQVRHRRGARRSDHQGQAVVPRRVQPLGLARDRRPASSTRRSTRTTTGSRMSTRPPGSRCTSGVTDSTIPIDLKTYFFTAKINGAINQDNQFQISAFGNPRVVQDVYTITRNPAQTRWKYDDGAYDVAGKWTSKLNGGKTQLDAVLGYHRGYDLGEPVQLGAGGRRPSLQLRALAERLRGPRGLPDHRRADDNSPNDPYPKIRNCPVSAYTEQGLGCSRTRSTTARRSRCRPPTASSSVRRATTCSRPASTSSSRATTRTTTSRAARSTRRSSDTSAGAPGRWQLREFYKFARNLTDAELADPSSVTLTNGQQLCADDQAICERADGLKANTSNRNIGAYLQDSGRSGRTSR